MIGGEIGIRKLDKVSATRYIWGDGNGTDELILTSGGEMIVLTFDGGEFSKIVTAIESHKLPDSILGIDEVNL